MKKLFVFTLCILLISCASDDPENCCTIIDTAVKIKYVNENGENLFDIENPIQISDIKVFHKINSEWIEYYKGNLDHPKGLMELEINEEKYLGVSVSIIHDADSISETKLQFANGDEDIIKTGLNLNANNIIVEKVWYNGELKWQTEDKQERNFTIVKLNY